MMVTEKGLHLSFFLGGQNRNIEKDRWPNIHYNLT